MMNKNNICNSMFIFVLSLFLLSCNSSNEEKLAIDNNKSLIEESKQEQIANSQIIIEGEIDTTGPKDLLVLAESGEFNSRPIKNNKFPGTNHYELTITEQSSVYDYELYEITISNHKEALGEVITVVNKGNESSFKIEDNWAIYFQGLIDHYMIIDQGSGTIRNLKIYDLEKKEIIFKNQYVETLKVTNGNVHFLDQVQIKNEVKKPECPQKLIDIGYGIGYVEELIYDVNKNKLYRSGQYQCWYFE